MAGPLEGVRVVDCSTGTAGPRATGLLADYGADVVWVEPPGGDPLRGRAPEAVSVFDRGKRSVVVDVTEESERDSLLRLLERADVFVESWAPGRADELGVGAAALRRLNPRLVQCSISAWGGDRPGAASPAQEGIVHASLGTMAEQQGHRDGPIYPGLGFAAIGASYLAVIGILGALHRRAEDGRGRLVETSLLDGALAYHSMLWGESDASLAAAATAPQLDPRQSTVNMRLITRSYECADHEFLGIHTGAVGAFGRLMKVLALDDRIPPSDTGLDIGVPLTDAQRVIAADEIPRLFALRPRAEWVDLLLQADVCAVEHMRPTHVFDSPQARHNAMVVRVDDRVLGPVEQVAPAAKFSATPARPDPRPAPSVGQHTRPVLSTSAGWSSQATPASVAEGGAARPLLAGVRILDFGAYYAGPYSSRLLADLGADVIKIEPVLGDQLRGLERPFFSAQAGKRAIAVDLKDQRLQRALRGLLEWADVLHHNLRPGAAERLGIDDESVRAVNPEIVYLYAPGWGATGPFRMRQSFAPMLSGYVGVTYEVAGQYNPPLPPIANEDPGNGLLGASAILMALLHRQRTGRGQYVENPQLNATMAHLSHIVRRPDGEVVGAGRLDPRQLGVGPGERLYETADGWVCVSAVESTERTALLEAMGVGEADDDSLALALADRFGHRTTAQAVQALEAVGVPVAVPVGRNNHDFMADPQHRRSGRVAEVAHPTKGNVRELAALLRVSDAAACPHRLAPELGQDTDEILGRFGYGASELAELRAAGAIR